jgi:hypothetical protein
MATYVLEGRTNEQHDPFTYNKAFLIIYPLCTVLLSSWPNSQTQFFWYQFVHGHPHCFSAIGKRPTQPSISYVSPVSLSGRRFFLSNCQVMLHQHTPTMFYTAYISKHTPPSHLLQVSSAVHHASVYTSIFWLSSWCHVPCMLQFLPVLIPSLMTSHDIMHKFYGLFFSKTNPEIR